LLKEEWAEKILEEADSSVVMAPEHADVLLFRFEVFFFLRFFFFHLFILFPVNSCSSSFLSSTLFSYRGLRVKFGLHFGTPHRQVDVATQKVNFFGHELTRALGLCKGISLNSAYFYFLTVTFLSFFTHLTHSH
jgi:hypothetical protein